MAGNTYVTQGYSTYTDSTINQCWAPKGTIERVSTPTHGYTGNVGSPSNAELLKEYGHSPTLSGGQKHAPKNHYDDHEPNYGLNYKNSSPPISPNNYTRGYFSEESNRVHSRPGYVKTGNISGHNKSWQAAGPPATHHPLTTSTNNVNEALGLLEESMYYSPRADPRRRGVLDNLPTRAESLEPQRRHAFVAKSNDPRAKMGSTIDSHEAARLYGGSLLPQKARKVIDSHEAARMYGGSLLP